MTLTIINTRDDNPRLRRRPARVSTGQVYYGARLRRVIAPEPKPSIVERLTTWWDSLDTRVMLVFIGCVVAWVVIAALIVL